MPPFTIMHKSQQAYHVEGWYNGYDSRLGLQTLQGFKPTGLHAREALGFKPGVEPYFSFFFVHTTL